MGLLSFFCVGRRYAVDSYDQFLELEPLGVPVVVVSEAADGIVAAKAQAKAEWIAKPLSHVPAAVPVTDVVHDDCFPGLLVSGDASKFACLNSAVSVCWNALLKEGLATHLVEFFPRDVDSKGKTGPVDMHRLSQAVRCMEELRDGRWAIEIDTLEDYEHLCLEDKQLKDAYAIVRNDAGSQRIMISRRILNGSLKYSQTTNAYKLYVAFCVQAIVHSFASCYLFRVAGGAESVAATAVDIRRAGCMLLRQIFPFAMKCKRIDPAGRTDDSVCDYDFLSREWDCKSTYELCPFTLEQDVDETDASYASDGKMAGVQRFLKPSIFGNKANNEKFKKQRLAVGTISRMWSSKVVSADAEPSIVTLGTLPAVVGFMDHNLDC